MQNKKHLSVFGLVVINVVAVDSLRTLPFAAKYGSSILIAYVAAALLFLIPAALTIAELATAWPNKGGIYVWVREAFGKRVGLAVIALQWIYNIVWYPTIMAFIAGTLAYLIHPHWAQSPSYLLGMSLLIFWITTLLNCFGMRTASWISALGAVLGTALPMLLIIGLGAMWFFEGRPMQIHHLWQLPTDLHSHYPAFLMAILFGLLGLEISAAHADEVKNPARDFPRALLYSSLIILVTLTGASLAMALILPSEKINIITGPIAAFAEFFHALHWPWMVPIITAMIVLGAFASVSAWVIGPAKGLLVATEDGSLPPILRHTNQKGVPVAVLFLQAVIFSILCTSFIVLPSISASYWLLTAITAQLALLVYVAMFAAVLKLRYTRPEQTRPYQIPGGKLGLWLVAGTGLFTSIGAIGLGFLPPHELSKMAMVHYERFLALGIGLFCLIPIALSCCYGKKS